VRSAGDISRTPILRGRWTKHVDRSEDPALTPAEADKPVVRAPAAAPDLAGASGAGPPAAPERRGGRMAPSIDEGEAGLMRDAYVQRVAVDFECVESGIKGNVAAGIDANPAHIDLSDRTLPDEILEIFPDRLMADQGATRETEMAERLARLVGVDVHARLRSCVAHSSARLRALPHRVSPRELDPCSTIDVERPAASAASRHATVGVAPSGANCTAHNFNSNM